MDILGVIIGAMLLACVVVSSVLLIKYTIDERKIDK